MLEISPAEASPLFEILSSVRVPDSPSRTLHSGLSVQDSGFRIQDSGFRIQGVGMRVEAVWGLGFGIEGFRAGLRSTDFC